MCSNPPNINIAHRERRVAVRDTMRGMRRTICFLVATLVLCLRTERATAFYCYPDYCQNLTNLIPIPDYQCVLTKVQRGEDCKRLKFGIDKELFEQRNGATFTLHAYVMNFDSQRKATAFNLSTSDVNFHRLVTRYQNIDNADENACRYVNLYGNISQLKDFYVSCPFSDAAFEGSAYRLQYLVVDNENHTYNKKYVFQVPQHEFIEEGVQIDLFTPFIYVDVSDSSNVALYVQPLPPRYNVMQYKIWLICNETGSAISNIVSANENHEHIRFNFSMPDGVYYVKATALHPDCGECGCANSTSPYIHIKQISNRLLIMIISLVWLPPVVLYTVYHIFKFYRRRVLKKIARRPKCLLVYSPTHPAHVSVMAELTKYLRYCSINAMMDIFDIAETASKDPGLWCNEAFQAADIVLVATSPTLSTKCNVAIVYQNLDNHFLRLLKENYPQRNKRYYAIHLPYCKSDNIPEEARLFKKFRIPQDLMKLVATIHGISCVRFLKASDNELLESIRFAIRRLYKDTITSNSDKMDNFELLLGNQLLPPVTFMEETTNHMNLDESIEIPRPDIPDGDVIPQSFTTNIDELNLLGENREEEAFVYNRTGEDREFRIDNLNL